MRQNPETDPARLAERILGYFDSYSLASVAPIVSELKAALDAEYLRGVGRGISVYRPEGVVQTGVIT